MFTAVLLSSGREPLVHGLGAGRQLDGDRGAPGRLAVLTFPDDR